MATNHQLDEKRVADLIARAEKAEAALAEANARAEKHYSEGMKAHRWLARIFGEQMNGRDFDVKLPMAEAELVSERAGAAALRRALEEVKDHLYDKQDMERCRELATGALATYAGTKFLEHMRRLEVTDSQRQDDCYASGVRDTEERFAEEKLAHDNDYADMRRFQADFIRRDQECRDLLEAAQPFVRWVESMSAAGSGLGDVCPVRVDPARLAEPGELILGDLRRLAEVAGRAKP